MADRLVRFMFPPPSTSTSTSRFSCRRSPFRPTDGIWYSAASAKTNGRRLWLHSFDSLESRPLPGTEGGPVRSGRLTVRPSGFSRVDRLKRTSIAGGDVVTICEARVGGGGTWNRDGVIVFAPGIERPVPGRRGRRHSDADHGVGSGARGERSHRAGVPPGRPSLPVRHIGRDGTGIYVASLDSPERKRLSTEDRSRLQRARLPLLHARPHAHGPTARPEASGVDRRADAGGGRRRSWGLAAAFAVSAAARWRTGQAPEHHPADVVSPRRHARRDVGTAGRIHEHRALARWTAGGGRSVRPHARDLAPRRGTRHRDQSDIRRSYESTPVWSPDAAAFVFAAARDTPPNLYLKRIGSGRRGGTAVPNRGSRAFPQSWSPMDASSRTSRMDPKTEADIWVLAPPASGSRHRFFTRSSLKHMRESRRTVDGWRTRRTSPGRTEVYVTRFPEPGGKWPVSTEGGGFPVWRRDSRELFYRAPDGKLMAVPIGAGDDFAPGAPIPLFEPRAARSAVSALARSTTSRPTDDF